MAARDIIQAAAGAAGATEAVYVEDVFSTYLYTGTGAAQTINNGIALGSSNVGTTSLKLDFDTNLTDVSSNAYTSSVTGTAARDTSTTKFGAASLGSFNGSSWVDYSASAGNFGSSDWTVEFWVKTTGTGSPGIVTQASAAGATNTSWGFFQGYGTANNIALYLSNGTNYFASILTGTTVINDGVWHHVAASRFGSIVYLFLDGVMQGSTSVGSTALGNGTAPVRIGGQGTNYAMPSGTNIDDVRIIKGLALYTSNFSPPASATSTATIASVAGKGGLVWLKPRNQPYNNNLYDTSRGVNNFLVSNTTDPAYTQASADLVTAFNTNGFTLGADANQWFANKSAVTYASWTFRKQPKFFDVVTYTGNGVAGRQIAHSLGATPGMIIVKQTDGSNIWPVYHKSTGATNVLSLSNTWAASASSVYWNDTAPTSTVFTVGSGAPVNNSGNTYVAYLFADSNSGGFGSAGTDSVVACGSYTGNGSASGPIVNLGWEPQFILVKNATSSWNWAVVDVVRGMSRSNSQRLSPNVTDIEDSGNFINPITNGFQLATSNLVFNNNGDTYIYLAIRRGPMKTPTDATKVFKPITYTGNGQAGQTLSTGFPVDMFINCDRTNSANMTGYTFPMFTRLLSLANAINTASTDIWTGGWGSAYWRDDSSDGLIIPTGTGPNSFNNQPGITFVNYNFRRAPGFFDVVYWKGTGSTGTVNHNLGVTPELVIYKTLDVVQLWGVYSPLGTTGTLILNSNAAANSSNAASWFNSLAPTSSLLNVGTTWNSSSTAYIAYLFATCPGVSKVGTFNINASDVNVDCGFTNGARFILVKRTDATGGWLVCDTARGIVNGNDPYLQLNAAAAEGTTLDLYAPYSAGFTAKAASFGGAPASYIYLAIA